MRFSLIHPSMGRPEQALACFNTWRGFASDVGIQHIVSLSANDPTIDTYTSLFTTDDSAVIVSPATNMVAASNIAAERADGDVLILISDDMFPPMGWATKITPYLDVHWPVVLQVHDELVFDAHKDEVEKLKPLVVANMESAMELLTPVVAEVGVGLNWLEAH